MLALTRKKNEAIVIDGKIKIRVLDVQEGKVKIGIDAPKEMSIHREEVYLEIENNNKDSLDLNRANLQDLAKLIKSKDIGN